jgi:hypothetical protein
VLINWRYRFGFLLKYNFISVDDLISFRNENLGGQINLSEYEKTIIYKYALDYYEDLNSELRFGNLSNSIVKATFCQFLNERLDKLPEYKGVVYRGAKLNSIQKYIDALKTSTTVIEKGFTSSSTSKLIGSKFSGGLVAFSILSKHGRLIQDLSRYGTNSSQNERKYFSNQVLNF